MGGGMSTWRPHPNISRFIQALHRLTPEEIDFLVEELCKEKAKREGDSN